MKDVSEYTLEEIKELDKRWLDGAELWELKNCNRNVVNCESLGYNKEFYYRTEKINLTDGTYITVTLD